MPGYYSLCINMEKFNAPSTKGSYNLAAARVLGISYADSLRLMRDSFGATIIGKNTKYPYAVFKRSNEVNKLLELLNKRANAIMFLHDNPDFEEHKKIVEESYNA